MKSKRERAKQILSNLVELFKSGEALESITKSVLPASNLPSSKWSLTNRLLMMIQGTDDARGFRQWQEVGRYVKKGSKAIYILAPCTVRRTIELEDGTQEEKFFLSGFRTLAVFRSEDTEGEPLPDLAPQDPPPLLDVAERYGLSLKYQGFLGSYYGYFSSDSKKIVLCTHDAAVYFHELAHAAHDKITNGLKGGQDPTQEIVAELSAAVLARLYGIKWDLNAYNYILAYSKGKKVGTTCVKVIAEVEKVLDEILDKQQPIKSALS